MSLLILEGETIGAIYAMAFNQTAYFYQLGFDPRKARISPGTLLVASTIRMSIDEGLMRFDFMRGDESYKRRWKPQHELLNERIVLPLGQGIGRVGAAWQVGAHNLESKVRERLERGGNKRDRPGGG
jgi:CelD/BcsL family acetyltransferase involved in cellulose biosynthesis